MSSQSPDPRYHLERCGYLRRLLAHLVSFTLLAAQPVSLASPGLSSLNIEKDAATYYSDHFAQQLTQAGTQFTGRTTIRQTAGS